MSDETKLPISPEYMNANGYYVTVEVTYRKRIRVRAIDESQAETFAVNRERQSAEKFAKYRNFAQHKVVKVKAKRVRRKDDR